ncbi:tubulin-specific chaperone E [Fundulus diaphanus]
MRADRTGTEMPTDPVGKRIACGGERATVRYVGQVPPYEGLWLGVEWDNPERGKHDGSHEGVQYFTCRNPKAGSFVRPPKVSFGVDFLTALNIVYEYNVEEVLREEVSVSGKKLQWYAVEERRLENLPSVLLNNQEVNGPGAAGAIRKMTPSIKWLELCGSLMSTWEDVAAITEQLEKLERLNLSYNRISLTSDPWAHRPAFCNLKELSLKDCDLTWSQVLECAPMWPQLEELSLLNNNITELQKPEGVLQTLKHLNLHCNPLVQESVCSLSALPRLEHLNLSQTRLSFIQLGDAAQAGCSAPFSALESLIVDHNNISEWCVIDDLAKLPCLVRLSCQGNKLLSSDGKPSTAKQMIIAKLGRLVCLNNCKIDANERKGAELDYIKMFGEEWLKAGGLHHPSTEFARQHPRYQTLIEKYGAPDEGELKKPDSFALKNRLLKITFVFPDHAEQKPIEKKLPASMVIQKVKGLLYRLLNVPLADLRLTYTSPKMLGTEFDIDSDLKTLQFYSIEDGDRVLVRWTT